MTGTQGCLFERMGCDNSGACVLATGCGCESVRDGAPAEKVCLMADDAGDGAPDGLGIVSCEGVGEGDVDGLSLGWFGSRLRAKA